MHPAYAGFRAGSVLARVLPRPVITSLAERAASRLSRRVTARRRQVVRNVRRTMGDSLDAPSIDRAVAATYADYARYYVESARLVRSSLAAVDDGFTVEGFENIENSVAAGNGTILALPHLGGWEWAGFWLAGVPDYDVTAVVEAIEPPELHELFVRYRNIYGMNIITVGPSAGAEVSRALRDNHVVCLLCDRLVAGAAVEVEFFGETTELPAGPATLALRTGAAIVPVGVFHRGPRNHAIVRPPVPAERSGGFRDDVRRITQAVTDELERLILVAPEQWHLLQPNWPSDHAVEAELDQPATGGGVAA